MGLLNFLNKRTSADAAFEPALARQGFPATAPALPKSRGTHSSQTGNPRTVEELQRSSNAWTQCRGATSIEISSGGASASMKPRLVGIKEGQPADAQYTDEAESQQKRPKSSGRHPREAIRGLSLNLGSINGDKNRLPRDRVPPPNIVSPLSPIKHDLPASGPGRRPSTFVDILDAQGEIRTYDFKSRVAASGSRDYGEDVADRNIMENGPCSPSLPTVSAVAGVPLPFRNRGSVSTAAIYRSACRTERILEEGAFPDEDSDSPSLSSKSVTRIESVPQRLRAALSTHSSRAMSLDSVAPDYTLSEDDSRAIHGKARGRHGKLPRQESRRTTCARFPTLSISRSTRDDATSVELDPQGAPSPCIQDCKLRQYSLPTDQLPNRVTRGSVRAAREALRTGGFARERMMRCESFAQPLPHHRLENYCDWSRFDRSALGEHVQATPRPWDDTSSAHSDGPRGLSLMHSTARSRIEERERHAMIWIPQRQSSIASSTPPTCDHASPRFTGARSIQTAETSSIDLPHVPFFGEMKFGASSRSIQSRGGDSLIAPDCMGPDEDSCGDSVFISPATPVKEEADLSPLSGKRLESAFSGTGYESTSIYDSDTESFREKRRWLQPEGETLVYQDRVFGSEDKTLPGLFSDASDLGDDERSIAEAAFHGPQQTEQSGAARPFTQRERLLALGYDYDSDSDVESPAGSDEMAEERALMLLTSLMESGGLTSGQRGEHKINMNTVAKLRREIRRRKRTGVVNRRTNLAPASNDEGDDHFPITTK